MMPRKYDEKEFILRHVMNATDYWADFIAEKMASELWSTPDNNMIEKLGNDLWIYARFGNGMAFNGNLSIDFKESPPDYIMTDWGGQVWAQIKVPIESFIEKISEECGMSKSGILKIYDAKGKGPRKYVVRTVSGFYRVYVKTKSDKNPSDVYRYCVCGHTDSHHYNYYGRQGVCAFCACRGFRTGRAEENPPSAIVRRPPIPIQRLPDNEQWTNRMAISGSTGNRYIIARRKGTKKWGCSCPGWVFKRPGKPRKCRHLTTMMPYLKQLASGKQRLQLRGITKVI